MKIRITILLLGMMVSGHWAIGAQDHYSMLQSTVPSVRRIGVMGIAASRDTSTIGLLGGILQNDPHFTVRSQAAEAMGNMRSREATPFLTAALEDISRNVKASVIVSMGYIRDSESVDPLIAFVKAEQDQGLVISALNVLGVIGDAKAVPLLVDSLRSENSRIRQIAAQSLGRLKSSDSADSLIAASGDSDRTVRIQAVRALGEIGSERALRPLRRSLRREEDGEVKVAMAHAIGQLGYDDGINIALDAVRSENINIKRSGLRALAAIRKLTPEVEAAVTQAFIEGNTAVKRDAEIAASFLDIKLPGSAE